MKRITTLILTLAFILGTFMPVTAALTTEGVSFGLQTVSAQEATASASYKEDELLKEEFDCGIIGSSSSIGGCLEWIFYFIPYSVGGLLLTWSAKILDVTAAYTLSSSLYGASSFISDGWRVTRDFANIFFLFILLYIAVSMVLGLSTGHTTPKRMLVSVVLVAMLINFSMFFTQIVIDTSNTIALLFYNQITVLDKNDKDAVSEDTAKITSSTGVEQRPMAAALAQAFKPHAFQDKAFFENLRDKDTGTVPVAFMILILIGVGSMFCIAAYSFFIASLSFMGRLVQLMISIIFAPFAFMTLIVPGLSEKEGFGWKSWVSSLMGAAFGAPIYFFFLLLISIMAKSPFVARIDANAIVDPWTTLVTLFVSFMVLIIMLSKATKYAKESAGQAGVMMANLGTSALKLAGGMALGTMAGGLAMGGQQTLGRIGRRISQSETLKNIATSTGTGFGSNLTRGLAKASLTRGNALASSSFDASGTTAGKFAADKLGIKFKTLPAISPAANRGGINARIKRSEEKDKKFAESLGVDKEKQKQLDKTVKDREKAISEAEIAFAQAKASATSGAAPEQAAVKAAEAKLQQANAMVVGLGGVGQQAKDAAIASASSELSTAKSGLETKLNAVKDAQKKLDDLRKGKTYDVLDAKGKKTGEKLYTMDDVKAGKAKIEDLGLEDQKRLAENNKKRRANAYLYHQMQKKGYKINGMKEDALGAIENVGTIDPRTAARGMKDSLKNNFLNSYRDMVANADVKAGEVARNAISTVGEMLNFSGHIIATQAAAATASGQGAQRASDELRTQVASNMQNLAQAFPGNGPITGPGLRPIPPVTPPPPSGGSGGAVPLPQMPANLPPVRQKVPVNNPGRAA